LKAVAIVVVLILAYTCAVSYSQLYGYAITVQTDKLYYHAGDRVYISGRYTYNGYPSGQHVSVSIYVARANYFGTAYTNADGYYASSLTLGTNAGLGTYVVSVTAPYCTNQTTFQVIITPPFVVPATPLGPLAVIATMISTFGVYTKLRKRKL
jgi:hypothetical protein